MRVSARHMLAASSCRSRSQALLPLLSATGRAQEDPRRTEKRHKTARKEDAMRVPMAERQDLRTKQAEA